MLRHSACAAFLIAGLSALGPFASAQSLPSVSALSGAYSVRYLGVNSGGASDVAVSFSGTFTFDGKGGFTVAGQGTTGSGPLQILTTGKYNVYSNGMIEFLNPFDNSGQSVLYGGVGSNGILFASSTESFYVDMIVAIPQATAASNTTLKGTYNVASLEFLGGSLNATRDTFSSMTADGSGSLGTVTINGTAQSLNGTATTQTSAAATYSVTANGTGTLTLPAPSGVSAGNALLSGAKVLAVSSDGSVFIAGTQTGFDFVIGIKSPGATSTQQLNGLYFAGYLNNYAPGTSNQTVYAAQGAINEIPSLQNLEIAHQRTNSDFTFPYDFVYSDTFTFNTGGTVSYTSDPSISAAYAISPNGDMVIGAGLGATNYELVFYVRCPAMSGTGVFLNPQGVTNSASSAPFTAQYSPGEVITLYGTGMASADASLTGLPFPTTMGNVQIKVGDGSTSNFLNAPIYNVCASCNPQQIAAVIPYNVSTSTGYITFQVVNNGNASNTVFGYLGGTSPGVFTVPPGGPFTGAIQHAADFSLVTTSSPAKAGETVVVYLSGLGAINPAVTAGAAPTATTQVVAPVEVYIGGQQATVSFAGISGVAGLYQLNVVVPSGVTSGTQSIEILTGAVDSSGNTYLDVDALEALIPIK